ncbi:hypothetical protein FHR49_003831 [Xanthomonas campestris]
MTEPTVRDVLRDLDLGSSVAEYDNSLEQYFIENEAFHSLVNGRADIIAGDKGTGKTALYRILRQRFGKIPELKNVEVIEGFNPAGNPIFQRLVQQEVLSEGQYASVWKAYIISLAGNWLIEIVGKDYSSKVTELHEVLERTGLRSKDDKAETIFGRIITAIQRALRPSAAEMEFTFSESGIPIVKPRIEFDAANDSQNLENSEVPHEAALSLLNDCLSEIDITVWIALDRLDEAFQGFPDVEVPALRALLRTFLDLSAFGKIKLKIFVRRDLFSRIVGSGFVNLTHVNARKTEIIWEEEDLLNLLTKRIRDNIKFSITVGITADSTDQDVFYALFPGKVDQATRKPTTLSWIMSRIRDGKGVKPPRNLIDLANNAREKQIQIDSRAPQRFVNGLPLISPDAIRSSHEKLSEQRVTDTLFAETADSTRDLIAKFRRSKAEHNKETLAETLALTGNELDRAVDQLVQVGFLEELPTSWKIPMLYRDGLDITQGKAFTESNLDQNADVDIDET